jgi:hypothetical protein
MWRFREYGRLFKTRRTTNNMILNIKNKEDLITLDFRIKQIRYLKDIENQGEIIFIDMSQSDVEAYEYLFKEDRGLFFDSLIEDIKGFAGIDVDKKNLVVPEQKWA